MVIKMDHRAVKINSWTALIARTTAISTLGLTVNKKQRA